MGPLQGTTGTANGPAAVHFRTLTHARLQLPRLTPRPFLLAVGTLTAVRVRARGEASAEEQRAATAFYPLVGLGVGAVPAAALLLPFPPLPLATLALVAWVLVTGAGRLGGWAACCDAAFAPPGRRAAALADPRPGVSGVVGTVLLLLGKWTALVYAPPVAPLLAAPTARWAMVHALRSHPAAPGEGPGAALAGRGRLWAATAVLMAIVLPLVGASAEPLRLAGAVIAAAAAALLVGELLARRFGGVAAGVCGALGEAAELAALWAFVPLWRP